jgi:hypothetical protein
MANWVGEMPSIGDATGYCAVICYAFISRRRKFSQNMVVGQSEAGLADHVWDMEELVALLPEYKPMKRGPYKKRISD